MVHYQLMFHKIQFIETLCIKFIIFAFHCLIYVQISSKYTVLSSDFVEFIFRVIRWTHLSINIRFYKIGNNLFFFLRLFFRFDFRKWRYSISKLRTFRELKLQLINAFIRNSKIDKTNGSEDFFPFPTKIRKKYRNPFSPNPSKVGGSFRRVFHAWNVATSPYDYASPASFQEVSLRRFCKMFRTMNIQGVGWIVSFK